MKDMKMGVNVNKNDMKSQRGGGYNLPTLKQLGFILTKLLIQILLFGIEVSIPGLINHEPNSHIQILPEFFTEFIDEKSNK